MREIPGSPIKNIYLENISQRWLKRIIELVCSALFLFLKTVLRFSKNLFHRKEEFKSITVITYHSIPERDIEKFSTQMRIVSKCAVPIFPDQVPKDGQRGVAVTFDDGFQTVFDHALPIMRRFEIPATLFLPAGSLGELPGWVKFENDRDARRSNLVKGRDLGGLDFRLVKVGSHSVSHPHLNRLSGKALEKELTRSKQILEELTGGPITMLSLPFGSYNQEVIDKARESGYALVFANIPLLKSKPDDFFLVGRINVSPGDWGWEFKLKILGAYEWLAWAIPIKRALLSRVRTK